MLSDKKNGEGHFRLVPPCGRKVQDEWKFQIYRRVSDFVDCSRVMGLIIKQTVASRPDVSHKPYRPPMFSSKKSQGLVPWQKKLMGTYSDIAYGRCDFFVKMNKENTYDVILFNWDCTPKPIIWDNQWIIIFYDAEFQARTRPSARFQVPKFTRLQNPNRPRQWYYSQHQKAY